MPPTGVAEKALRLTEMIRENLSKVDEGELDGLIRALLRTIGSGKIFVVGAGRSGLVGRAFAMRLMHVGFSVYVVGETVTPALKPGDVLIAISGSGETRYPITIAQEAKKIGALVVAVTSFPNSTLGSLADAVVTIGGRVVPRGQKDYEARQIMGIHEPLTPLGTLFELSAMVLLDAVIAEMVHLLGKSEEDLANRHATVE